MKNENLHPVFYKIKELFAPYAKELTPKNDVEGNYDLYAFKKVEAFGKLRDEMFFAGIIVQKAFVGFYLMPIYSHPELKEKLPEILLKKLKGKSCFHIKALDEDLEKAISTALEIGYETYKKIDWL